MVSQLECAHYLISSSLPGSIYSFTVETVSFVEIRTSGSAPVHSLAGKLN